VSGGRGKGWKRIRAPRASERACSVRGCARPELCGVGTSNTPLCRRHYEAWLELNKHVIDAALDLFNGAQS